MQRVEVQLEDDLTGGPADETVEFGIDGKTYAVDLNSKHAAEFRRQLARFVEHARPARSGPRGAIRTAATRQRSRQIRAWAEQHGLAVAEHGRLPGSVVHQYEAARNGGQTPARRARRSPAKGRGSSKRPQLSGISTKLARSVIEHCRDGLDFDQLILVAENGHAGLRAPVTSTLMDA